MLRCQGSSNHLSVVRKEGGRTTVLFKQPPPNQICVLPLRFCPQICDGLVLHRNRRCGCFSTPSALATRIRDANGNIKPSSATARSSVCRSSHPINPTTVWLSFFRQSKAASHGKDSVFLCPHSENDRIALWKVLFAASFV